jgi:hypothetical protein
MLLTFPFTMLLTPITTASQSRKAPSQMMNDGNQPISPNAPALGKACGACTLCCKVLGITALQKPHGTWCRHCSPGVGCRIYSERPEECRTFFCMWLVDARLGPEWKPDRSKIIVTTSRSGNGLDIRCDPGFPEAWRREPYRRQIQEWSVAARPHDGTVLVCVGNRTTLIMPEGEFPLGEVQDDDRIVKEYAGSRLAGVRLVKTGELDNSGKRH